ncbi:MAG: hypothetical protein WC527_04945 [Candidatus Margulisiibacteriota bacterium]
MAGQINPEEIRTLDIKTVALKDDYGALKFTKSLNYLEMLQSLFVEFDDLQYKENLSGPEITIINNLRHKFVTYLNRVNSFDLRQSNSGPEHDQIENEIQRLYEVAMQDTKINLVYLRQQAARKSADLQELEKQQKAAIQAEKEYKDLSSKMREELKALQTQKSKIESTKGEVAAITFGKHFESQYKENDSESKKWLKGRTIAFWVLLGLILANLTMYIVLFITNKVNQWPHLSPREIFNIEYAFIWGALLTILSYGLAFSTRNFVINSNLSVINKHRKNVSETLENFLSKDIDPEVKTQIIKQGTEAMFKHLPIGYIDKFREIGPVQEIITTIGQRKD